MPDFISQPWFLWVVAGIGLYLAVRGGADLTMIRDWFQRPVQPTPTVPLPVGPPIVPPATPTDAVAAYMSLAAQLHDCPKGLTALKAVWEHLDPMHVHK